MSAKIFWMLLSIKDSPLDGYCLVFFSSFCSSCSVSPKILVMDFFFLFKPGQGGVVPFSRSFSCCLVILYLLIKAVMSLVGVMLLMFSPLCCDVF